MISPAHHTRCESIHAAHDLWAITCYFNPCRYRRRLANYRLFRSRLKTPLIAVELSFNGRMDLGPADADILLQFTSGDVMWQKERLLNLALGALPPECRYVAWIDADVMFERHDWPELAARALDDCPLVQLFSDAWLLDADWTADRPPQQHVERHRPSFAAGLRSGLDVDTCLIHPSLNVRTGTYAIGLAWAARRELLDRHGLLDINIIGGGDRAMLTAACGRFDHCREWHCQNEHQRRCYRRWAEPFHDSVQGRVRSIPGNLYHFWHGSMQHRSAHTRHIGLRPFDFDPDRDIALDANGCWRWNSDKQGLHDYVRDYFMTRREDEAPQTAVAPVTTAEFQRQPLPE